MSEENTVTEKPKRGFANPDQRKNINRRGRGQGNKNKLPSNNEIRSEIKSGTLEAYKKIQQVMRRSDKDAEILKAAFKLMDTGVNFILEEEKLSVKKNNGGEKTQYNIQEGAVTGKKSGTTGNVVLLSTEFYDD